MIVYLVGFSTSGEHEQSPSVDVDVVATRSVATNRLRDILRNIEADEELIEEIDNWDESGDLFIDDEMGSLYYILRRSVGQRTINP